MKEEKRESSKRGGKKQRSAQAENLELSAAKLGHVLPP